MTANHGDCDVASLDALFDKCFTYPGRRLP